MLAAMEGLGAAASAIAVIELAAKVADLCLQYTLAVKTAKQDIKRLQQQTHSFKKVAESAWKLLQGPNGA
jgi:predicted phage tail protein